MSFIKKIVLFHIVTLYLLGCSSGPDFTPDSPKGLQGCDSVAYKQCRSDILKQISFCLEEYGRGIVIGTSTGRRCGRILEQYRLGVYDKTCKDLCNKVNLDYKYKSNCNVCRKPKPTVFRIK